MYQPAGQPRDVAAEFAEFDALLAREQPFVIVCDPRSEEQGEPDRDERTQVALWKRDRRAALKLYVKGMVMIEPDNARRLVTGPFAKFASKFWGYPVEVVADSAQARLQAQAWLNQ
ncbi:hypothetical protein FS595_02675 [Serratia rubidaea]|nr:hypothetical protein FS596_02675 [Serratia rubidaea]UJD87121.1 hypothetical protein FS595_02675 [Serratia rubidaea]